MMNDTITLNHTQKEQIQLKYAIDNFASSTKPKNQSKKDAKDIAFMSVNELLREWQMVPNALDKEIFPTYSRVLP